MQKLARLTAEPRRLLSGGSDLFVGLEAHDGPRAGELVTVSAYVNVDGG